MSEPDTWTWPDAYADWPWPPEPEVDSESFLATCPTCGEVTYQLAERDVHDAKLCDTCGTLYVPTGVVDVDHELSVDEPRRS